jgi:hypothetical protein
VQRLDLLLPILLLAMHRLVVLLTQEQQQQQQQAGHQPRCACQGLHAEPTALVLAPILQQQRLRRQCRLLEHVLLLGRQG